MWLWILAALMLFSGLKGLIAWTKRKMLPKEEQKLLEIREWRGKHLQKKKGSRKKELNYTPDGERMFALGSNSEKMDALTARAEKLADVYQQRLHSRRQLSKALRSDPLLDQIASVFLTTMMQYSRELEVFQFDRIAEDDYRTARIGQMVALLTHAEELMRRYGDYVQALVQSDSVDTAADREYIAESVHALEQVLSEVQAGSSASLPVPQIPAEIPAEPAESAAEPLQRSEQE